MRSEYDFSKSRKNPYAGPSRSSRAQVIHPNTPLERHAP